MNNLSTQWLGTSHKAALKHHQQCSLLTAILQSKTCKKWGGVLFIGAVEDKNLTHCAICGVKY